MGHLLLSLLIMQKKSLIMHEQGIVIINKVYVCNPTPNLVSMQNLGPNGPLFVNLINYAKTR